MDNKQAAEVSASGCLVMVFMFFVGAVVLGGCMMLFSL